MATQQLESKWEGKSIVNLKHPKAEQVWPLLEDFFNFHKWLPNIDTCHQIDSDNKDEIIRYCASTTPPSSGDGEAIIKWCHEKLLTIDKIERYISYEVLNNNIGIKYYVSTLKVLSLDGDDEGGCQIEWLFVADPIDGLTLELFSGYVNSSLQGMAENIEKALESSKLGDFVCSN
ncbi:lachrymatory-factor synthase-like [Solanum pennellii]|uniref:Lachrymatory-factor synthase-like n=1 Tax=Solanum pennellii TaxID=28526 RepID=A0ABM1HBN0_SOLPN|nr:lachrymatory-factor synthase-like [Solanum pennellii]